MQKIKTGRKALPAERKKVSVSVYLRPIDINKLGGKEALRDKINMYVYTLIDIVDDAN